MRPLYALHKDADGAILNATATEWGHELSAWLRTLDFRPGDRIEFGEKVSRKDPVEAAPPSPVEEQAA